MLHQPAFPARLRLRQLAFARDFVRHGVATRAYVAAGYSKKGAKQGAQRLLNNPPVRAYVSELVERTDKAAEKETILTRKEALIALSQAFRDAFKQIELLGSGAGGRWTRKDGVIFRRCVRCMCETVDCLARMQGWYEWRRPRFDKFGW